MPITNFGDADVADATLWHTIAETGFKGGKVLTLDKQ